MQKNLQERSNKGISLISLIITIIVIIILAAIVIFTGLNTPDRANFAKYTQNISDFNMAVTQDFMERKTKYALEGQTRNDAQIYYTIASGIELDVGEEPYADDTVSSIESTYQILPEGLKGNEVYLISDDANIKGINKQRQYYEPNEQHYITDAGETFTLPGYPVELDGTTRWYINSSKYYEGEPIRTASTSTSWQTPEAPGKGVNSTFKWEIYTPAQLKFLADYVNNGNSLEGDEASLTSIVQDAGFNPSDVTMSESTTINLMSNLDFGARPGNGNTEEQRWETTANEALKWTPIGYGVVSTGKWMKGIFDGKGHTIRGIYENRTDNFSGIFGNANIIQNLTIANSYIKGATATGGIVGATRETGKVYNCHNKNTTVILREGNYYYVGGIIGQASSNTEGVFNCTNTGAVYGYGSHPTSNLTGAGGIVGSVSTGTVIGICSNSGSVTGNNNCVGGISGLIAGTVEKCYNSGTITQKGGTGNLGGIAGGTNVNTTVKILNCYNTGNVIEEENDTGGVGGIIGWVSSTGGQGEIRYNYSSGNITINGSNVTKVGGAVGRYATDTFTIDHNYYETGKTNATFYTPSYDEGLSASDMKTQTFADKLNEDQTPAAWKIDGSNNGYPILIKN